MALSRSVTAPSGGGGAPGPPGPAGPPPSFIYREGGVAAGNVYTSFRAAYDAAVAAGGGCTIGIDPSLGAPVAGAGAMYMLALYDITLRSFGSSVLIPGLNPLTFPEGATVDAFNCVERLAIIGTADVTPTCTGTVAGTGITTHYFWASSLQATGLAPLIDTDDGADTELVLDAGSSLLTGLGGAGSVATVRSNGPGANVDVDLLGNGTVVQGASIMGTGFASANVFTSGATVSTGQPGLTSGLAVSVNVAQLEIIFRPGAVSAKGVVATWAEVRSFIAAGGTLVRCDDSGGACVATGDTQCSGVTFSPYSGVLGANTLAIADGAILRNPIFSGTLTVSISSTVQRPIIVESGRYLLLKDGAVVTGTSTVSFVEAQNNATILVDGSSGFNTGPQGAFPAAIHVLAFVSISFGNNSGWWNPASSPPGNLLEGAAGQANINYDSTIDPSLLTNQLSFAGTIGLFPEVIIGERGQATIDGATGQTADIPSASITGNSIVLIAQFGPSGDANTKTYAALPGDVVNRTSFKISALSTAGGGALNAADGSTVRWAIVGSV